MMEFLSPGVALISKWPNCLPLKRSKGFKIFLSSYVEITFHFLLRHSVNRCSP